MLHAFNILCKFSLSEYVDGDFMFFDVGLPWFAKSYVADFLPFFLLLGTNTARPSQMALRATAVWWSFVSPATTSVIAELRCLGLGAAHWCRGNQRPFGKRYFPGAVATGDLQGFGGEVCVRPQGVYEVRV